MSLTFVWNGRTIALDEATRQLQRDLQALLEAHEPDLRRYGLSSPPLPPGLYWKARWSVGFFLRCLEALRIKPPDPWPVRLRHAPGKKRERPLVIWAVGADRDALREACSRLDRSSALAGDHVPVLVTDVADFAYFSRLRWLVEYVPTLAGTGPSYAAQKAAFIAGLYRDADVIPYQSLR